VFHYFCSLEAFGFAPKENVEVDPNGFGGTVAPEALDGAPKTDVEPASEGLLPKIFDPPKSEAPPVLPKGEGPAPDPKGFAPNGLEVELAFELAFG